MRIICSENERYKDTRDCSVFLLGLSIEVSSCLYSSPRSPEMSSRNTNQANWKIHRKTKASISQELEGILCPGSHGSNLKKPVMHVSQGSSARLTPCSPAKCQGISLIYC